MKHHSNPEKILGILLEIILIAFSVYKDVTPNYGAFGEKKKQKRISLPASDTLKYLRIIGQSSSPKIRWFQSTFFPIFLEI